MQNSKREAMINSQVSMMEGGAKLAEKFQSQDCFDGE